jgi:hypothetical protein
MKIIEHRTLSAIQMAAACNHPLEITRFERCLVWRITHGFKPTEAVMELRDEDLFLSDPRFHEVEVKILNWLREVHQYEIPQPALP